MTAKPQPMAGQPDPADDLIAELARLMAQDAESERPAAPPPPARPAPVRIPGGEPSAPPQRPHGSAATGEGAEPFRFDLGISGSQPKPSAPVESSPQREPLAAVPQQPPRDSIADLIAAEMAEPVSEAPTPQPQPAPAPTATAPTEPREPVQQPRPVEPAPAARVEQNARPEVDQFRVAPVFGLTTSRPVEPTVSVAVPVAPSIPAAPASVQAVPAPAPAPAQQRPSASADVDPISEIESLIGSAVRIDLDSAREAAEVQPDRGTPEVQSVAASAAKPVASPALRSLATPTLPRELQADERRVTSADEAILAAAEATGAEIGWVDAPEEPFAAPPRDPRLRRPRMPRSFGFSRAVAGPLVAVTLLVVAGGGLYWVLGSGGESGPAPLLTADASPVKEMPAVETASAAAPQSVVFNEIEGVPPSADEQLVSRDQADVNEVTQVATPDVSAEGLANRKVRTVTVRPDGTIVSGDESLAGSTILPVDRPNVPDVPGAQTASPALLASTQEASTMAPAAGDPLTPEGPSADATASEDAVTVAPVEPGTIVPAVDVSGNPIAGRSAPVPVQRPADLAQVATPSPFTPPAPTSPVNAVIDPLPATPAATAQQPTAADTAPAYVQLASQRTEQDALATANQLVSRFGPIFNGANMEIQRADLGTRGIYYRVRVPASSMQQAAEMCNNVKAQGGDCVAM
jgi:hypothetical protein